jgi:hypothetical protein
MLYIYENAILVALQVIEWHLFVGANFVVFGHHHKERQSDVRDEPVTKAKISG